MLYIHIYIPIFVFINTTGMSDLKIIKLQEKVNTDFQYCNSQSPSLIICISIVWFQASASQ